MPVAHSLCLNYWLIPGSLFVVRTSPHSLFVRCSYAARASSVRCSRVVRTLFVRARTHPRTTRRAPLASGSLLSALDCGLADNTFFKNKSDLGSVRKARREETVTGIQRRCHRRARRSSPPTSELKKHELRYIPEKEEGYVRPRVCGVGSAGRSAI
jgi:hypothetical protein